MNFKEQTKILLDGGKIRKLNWDNGVYIYMKSVDISNEYEDEGILLRIIQRIKNDVFHGFKEVEYSYDKEDKNSNDFEEYNEEEKDLLT